MPCRSDYMDPTGQELESKRVCAFIQYLQKKTNNVVPTWVVEAAKDYYGNVNRLDEATKILCELCRGLTKEETEKYIYDPHDRVARKLATWWENHQEYDRRRVLEERAARKKVVTRERALKKLTVEEMKALGLVDEDDVRTIKKKLGIKNY